MKEPNRFDILTDINIDFINKENNWVSYYRLINEKGKSLDEDYGEIDRNSLLEYMQYDCGVITRDGEICKLNKKGLQISNNGGWLKHLEIETKSEVKIIETEIINQDLENDIKRLTKENLILQNKDLKRKVWFGVLGFIAGAILTNLKYILTLLKILPQE